ncbi:MAG TPA: nitrilase-related carbon-nitrogen hydrolase [Aliidongia sp.]|uniref:nitrilase-related carbon-nitrogen hydrolase n=1 Tax=Aliidongia sp. TaxID=1914230 RepID=UPI002DDCCE3A|nr:nitrilase-related carbon-nitrogen hydrolase [Aliidongia sp.]HEV2677526.1 nitrilase-related carbon-nitrogen hydrolase [Aliidongia sp.]
MKVAAAQIACQAGDIQTNLAQHLALIEQARRARVDLVVFPELSLTGYQSDPDIASLARLAGCEELRGLAEAAGPMRASIGFIERGEDGRVYNAQALIGDGPTQVHRKINLPSYGNLRETRYYQRGSVIAPVRLDPDWRAATLICADSWNPALPWLAALDGATILLLPIASALSAVEGFDNPAGWDLNLRHTALTYGLPIVMANHCGGNLDFWGGSRILDAFGRECARADATTGLIVADLSPPDGITARRRLPTMRDANPHLVHRMLGRALGEPE